jgi:heat-inducible transcriptional repressor
MLSDRQSAILEALVDGHIRTGEPVSSRAILDASGLSVSTATIRNELVALETEGFVAQPHTSAGRVPTDLGFRYYVDHISPSHVRSAIQSKIDGFFTTVHAELTLMLQQTSDLLAELTNYPALVLGPGLEGDSVRAFHLVQLSSRAVLAIVVTETGRVTKELARLDVEVDPSEVAAAEAALSEQFVGGSLGGVGPRVDEAGVDLSDRAAAVADAAAAAASRTREGTRDLYLGGTSRLTSLWEDLSKVHRILELLEQQTAVNELLAETDAGTKVRIGSELPVDDLDLALISTSYGVGPLGRVGVLGPMRMDYKRTIEVVEEVGEGLGDNLGS